MPNTSLSKNQILKPIKRKYIPTKFQQFILQKKTIPVSYPIFPSQPQLQSKQFSICQTGKESIMQLSSLFQSKSIIKFPNNNKIRYYPTFRYRFPKYGNSQVTSKNSKKIFNRFTIICHENSSNSLCNATFSYKLNADRGIFQLVHYQNVHFHIFQGITQAKKFFMGLRDEFKGKLREQVLGERLKIERIQIQIQVEKRKQKQKQKQKQYLFQDQIPFQDKNQEEKEKEVTD